MYNSHPYLPSLPPLPSSPPSFPSLPSLPPLPSLPLPLPSPPLPPSPPSLPPSLPSPPSSLPPSHPPALPPSLPPSCPPKQSPSLGHQQFDSTTVCARVIGWSVPRPGGWTISDVLISIMVGGESQYRLQSPAFKTFADLSNINVGGGDEIFKLACLVGKADVVGINAFPARCGWQIIDVQVEESRCQYRSLWQAILLPPPCTSDVTHVDTKSPLSQEQFNATDGPTWYNFV